MAKIIILIDNNHMNILNKDMNILNKDILLEDFVNIDINDKEYRSCMLEVNNNLGKLTFILGYINMDLNRYYDVIPQDDTLVKGTFYINANYVDNNIITQHPLPQTEGHFWEMISSHNKKIIVMLNNFDGKFQQYWNDSFSSILEENSSFVIRNIGNIVHCNYYTWEDKSIPNIHSFLEFYYKIERYPGFYDGIVIHCGAGIGRSGVFAFIYCVMTLLRSGSKYINVYDTLLHLRKQRVRLIQNIEQLKFCIECLKKIIKDFYLLC